MTGLDWTGLALRLPTTTTTTLTTILLYYNALILTSWLPGVLYAGDVVLRDSKGTNEVHFGIETSNMTLVETRFAYHWPGFTVRTGQLR